MDDRILERRMLLRGAGLAGATALGGMALASPAAADDDHDHDKRHGSRVLGAWLITRQDDPPGDPAKVMGVVTFAEGGAFANQDIDPISPTGLGAWEAHGRSRFTVNFWGGAPTGPPPEPGIVFNVMVRGRVHDDEISGSYTVTAFQAGSMDEMGEFTGSFTGERIEA